MTHMPPENNNVPPQGVQSSAPQMPPAPTTQPYAAQQQPQFAPPPAPQYAQQPYGQPQPPYGQKPPTNALAVVSLISAFFVNIVGIILGHIALSQIKRTGESGRGLALAGTIIGYVSLGLSLIGVAIAIFFFGLFGSIGLAAGTADAFDSYESPSTTTPEPDSDLSYENPWVGTADEAFCDILLDFELESTDPQAFIEGLRDTTSDPALKEMAEKQLEYVSGARESATEEYFADIDAWYNAQYEAIDKCWAY